jgi:hypothetical protein
MLFCTETNKEQLKRERKYIVCLTLGDRDGFVAWAEKETTTRETIQKHSKTTKMTRMQS